MAKRKGIAISIVSLILVIGAVIGAVTFITTRHRASNKPAEINTPVNAVDSFCAQTTFKDVCANTLHSVGKNQTATPKDYLVAIIHATLGEVMKSFAFTKKTNVSKEAEPYEHMALEDCKDLLDQAIDTLQASYSMVGDNDMHTIYNRADELRSWMTSVYALQTTCTDQIQKPEYKSAIQNGMLNATQLTNNAVDILADLTEIWGSLNIPFTPKPVRRLTEVDSYPSWFSHADRKLLMLDDIQPNVVVAKDGSGQFDTVEAAINSYPKDHVGRFIIHVKAGVYKEFIIIDKKKPNIMIYGDGPDKTIITGDKNSARQSITTMNTATFSNSGFGFIARHLTFRNDAGPDGHQAVALRINANNSAIFDCHIEGYQDTLYYHTSRQFYSNCVISGTIDFIFGKGDAFIQNSLIVVRKPNANQENTITADGRELPKASNGLVLQNCTIVPEDALVDFRFNFSTYLGRPWKKDAVTVVMQSDIPDFIRPEGWSPWSTTDPAFFFHETCRYSEYSNRGLGSNTDRRSKLFKNFKVLDAVEAREYTVARFINGDSWLNETNMPHSLGFM